MGQNVQILVPPKLRTMEGEARREYSRDPNSRIIWNDRDLTVLARTAASFPSTSRSPRSRIDGRPLDRRLDPRQQCPARAEQARIEAEQHFRLAFEDNMAPMVFTDLEDRIIAANDAFCAMIGRTREELIGFDSKPFTYPDDVGITEAFARAVPSRRDPPGAAT